MQEADADGTVTFTSIFPAAYSGRWPHIHFEVYASLDEATAAGQISATSQIALPQDVCEQVYATDGYSQSVRNLAQTSLERDKVFGDDGGVSQLATVTGSVADGFTAALSVAVDRRWLSARPTWLTCECRAAEPSLEPRCDQVRPGPARWLPQVAVGDQLAGGEVQERGLRARLSRAWAGSRQPAACGACDRWSAGMGWPSSSGQ